MQHYVYFLYYTAQSLGQLAKSTLISGSTLKLQPFYIIHKYSTLTYTNIDISVINVEFPFYKINELRDEAKFSSVSLTLLK